MILERKNKITKLFLVFFIGAICRVEAYAFLPSNKQYPGASIAQVRPQHKQEIIVLIHGLLRSSLSMWPLKMYLRRQGYEVYSYSYPSAKYSIQEHGIYLNQFIKQLLAEHPGVKINFVTHSLGGIITREAVNQLTEQQIKSIGCLIMLAPPNQGSKLAKLSTQIIPLFISPIRPLAQLSSERSAYVHHVPVPNIKMGIIAGHYDAKVPPDFAGLPGKELRVVNSNHTFIMNNAKAKKLIMSFLKNGTFN